MTDRAVTDELLDGSADFTADLPPTGRSAPTFVTSPVAHARIEHLDTIPPRSQPGVVAVFTATDLPTVPIHEIALIPEAFAQPALADGEVRFVGEYVVAIVAETRAAAVDAAELVDVEYSTRLPSVIDPRESHDVALVVGRARGRRRVRRRRGHRACVAHDPAGRGGAHGGARHPRGAASTDGRLTLYASTQAPHWTASPARALARRPVRLACA